MKKFGVLFLLVTLVACASSDKPQQASKEEAAPTKAQREAKVKTEYLICPQTAILEQAQEVLDYGGETPDPAQLVAKARMASVEGDCAYRAKGIDLAFTLHIVSARGPRLGSQASFPYFVAVIDPAENILSRQVLTASFKFSNSDKTLAGDEKLHIFIPIPEAALQSGPDYRVLMGFQLPHAK